MVAYRHQAAVVAAGFAAFLNLYPPQALLPELESALGAAPGAAGLAVAASTLAVAIMAPFAGILADALGRRRVMAAAFTALGLATIMTGTANSLEAMLFWRFVCGLCIPGILAAAVGYIADELDPASAVRTTGHYIAGTVLGGFSGRFLAGLASEHLGWRMAFFLLGALTLVLVPLVVAGIKSRGPTSQGSNRLRATLVAARGHLGNGRLLATFAIGAGLLFSLVAMFTYVSFHLTAPPHGLSPGALGSVFAVYLLGVVVTPMTGAWITRFGRHRVATVALVMALAGIGLTVGASLPVIVTGLAVSSCGLFVIQSLATGFIAEAARGARSSAVGLYTSAYYLGGSLGAVVPMALWERFGWSGCVALLAAVYLMLLVVCQCLWRQREATTEPSANLGVVPAMR